MSENLNDLRTTHNLEVQITQLSKLNDFLTAICQNLEMDAFLGDLAGGIAAAAGCKRVAAFVPMAESGGLRCVASFPSELKQEIPALRELSVSIFQADDPVVSALYQSPVSWIQTADHESSRIAAALFARLGETSGAALPLVQNNQIQAVLFADQFLPDAGNQDSLTETLRNLMQKTAIHFRNVQVHSNTVAELAVKVQEQYILHQIDIELSDTIDLSHIFDMTLDWALRFTNAQAASLSLYDQESDTLRFMVEYGYEIDRERLETLRREYNGGITYRVARSGHVEIVPDVSMDKDFIRVHNSTQSQMSVPVMREDRVVAVMSLESKRLNGFADHHQDFVEKLASRAAVAIDNARLYEETELERQKLSYILSSTADVVIVVALDNRIMLINHAALAMLRLYPQDNYVGRSAYNIFENTPLVTVFQRAVKLGENLIEEMKLPDERTFYVNMTRHEGIGWIIVMHDITPFKEMDQLKSELIATVSHDLKQPLSVMHGYTELLTMQQFPTQQAGYFIGMIQRSITNMRQLIDDLLDLAKIESGITLNLEAINLSDILTECVEGIRPAANEKKITMLLQTAPNVTEIQADRRRLAQILNNLIGNAVKYTQPEGEVQVIAEARGSAVRISIQDNGMGISPEDQAHIFERFYRVRRPETDSIEGTGLGLAIVKSLVEAHNGQIGIKSHLGEGTTFFVTLPMQ
ncbi:MAG: GAF domain-containing protein [Anaerolineaceae bacterium]|nr:GAF domain-containing protein [Anaerolineaceae bacterium]